MNLEYLDAQGVRFKDEEQRVPRYIENVFSLRLAHPPKIRLSYVMCHLACGLIATEFCASFIPNRKP